MITSNDFKNGMTIELDGQLMTIVEFLHVKPGKGSAFVRTKLRNLKSGYVVEKTFRAGEKVTRAIIDKRTMQFLYSSGSDYNVMDTENYEQITLSAESLGDGVKWLKEGMGLIPREVASQLRGRLFANMRSFREALWKAVYNIPHLRDQFNAGSRAEMEIGHAPFAPEKWQLGGRVKYEIDHMEPLNIGWERAVYDLGNLMIVPPRIHAAL